MGGGGGDLFYVLTVIGLVLPDFEQFLLKISALRGFLGNRREFEEIWF